MIANQTNNVQHIHLKIDPANFTTCFWKVWSAKEFFLVLRGGAGAGKSYSVAQKEVIIGSQRKEKTLIIRKTATSLKDSVYSEFIDKFRKFGLAPFITTTLKPLDIHVGPSGSTFLFRGLDDPEKIKSIQGVTRIVIEEANELNYEDFKQLILRIRGVGTENAQITLVFNPVDEDHWIKKHFYDNVVDNCKKLKLTYKDNEFMLPKDIKNLEDQKNFDENYYRIYALAEWGKLKTGSEFLPHFSYPKHTGPVKFLPGRPIHLAFDFNARPYQPMLCAQIVERVLRYRNPVTGQRFKQDSHGFTKEYVTQVRFFKEYLGKAGDYPENTVSSVCEKFKTDFEEYGCDVFYYGDASGKYNIAGKGNATNFKDVRAVLGSMLNAASDRVPAANPNVMKARDFMNRIFADKYNIEILIDEENCKNLAKDLATILLGQNGVEKEYEKDAAGIKFQKNSHLHDAAKYLIVWIFKDLFKSSQHESKV